jgi:hypothetical protein
MAVIVVIPVPEILLFAPLNPVILELEVLPAPPNPTDTIYVPGGMVTPV